MKSDVLKSHEIQNMDLDIEPLRVLINLHFVERI
jgi:hypothetical protein